MGKKRIATKPATDPETASVLSDPPDTRDWLKRNSRGFIVWYQPLREAWMILTGKQSLHRAWNIGLFEGSRWEYERVVHNGGDLMPVIDAAIFVTVAEAKAPWLNSEMIAKLRAAAWQNYQENRAIRNSVREAS